MSGHELIEEPELGTVSPRPWTPDVHDLDGRTTVTVKRSCNGCGRSLGDASAAELLGAVAGLALPDVRRECGCATASVGEA